MHPYKFAVVIGRFQPFHLGHQRMLEKALQEGETVVVVLGSARAARNTKNPWSAREREQMLRAALAPEQQERVHVTHVRDYFYSDNLWVAEIQGRVREVIGEERSVCLVGCDKDASSYYLKLFPQWAFEEVAAIGALNATDIRAKLFSAPEALLGLDDAAFGAALDVPVGVGRLLREFCGTEPFGHLCAEHQFLEAYQAPYAELPYGVIFQTVDAVVIQSGHVLVVRRKGRPGKGLLALPGGFLNGQERIVDGVFRELKEETGIRVPGHTLRLALKEMRTFDAPNRSLRGRTISNTALIDLGYGDLPQVRGDDDAEKAFWMPLYDAFAREEEFFEDHLHIIRAFTQSNF